MYIVYSIGEVYRFRFGQALFPRKVPRRSGACWWCLAGWKWGVYLGKCVGEVVLEMICLGNAWENCGRGLIIFITCRFTHNSNLKIVAEQGL